MLRDIDAKSINRYKLKKNSFFIRTLRLILIVNFLCFYSKNASCQKPSFSINAYGHLGFESLFKKDTAYSDFKLGEQEIFVNAKFNKNFSFLGEITMNFSEHGNYKLNIERLRMKYNYYKNHSIIIGKFHTPVNYWNDVYFHARLFFPTIDRPIMFSKWIPVHTFGVRLQGQNLGKYNFGYDLLVGSGMNSEDIYNVFRETSITAAVHWKPIDNARFGITYYNTFMKDASAMAAHSHSGHHIASNPYKGPLNFQMANASFAYFGEKWEVLNEFSYNNTKTDTIGVAHNISNYTYVGYRIKAKNIPFIAYDFLLTSDNDLHTYPYDRMKFVLGFKHEFSTNLNVKTQVEYYRNIFDNNDHHSMGTMLEFKIQMSYGI